MPLSAGARLGPYEILSPLGAGGMGEVYRARDTRLRREVAVKVLPDVFARDSERLARFEREAQLLASLSHPNIAAIHGFDEADGMHFLVLELVVGETLAERLAEGRLELEEALNIGRQIAEGLDAAHERGVIHRDLKPSNVKITPEGKVKVLDFGLAKALGAESSAPDLSRSPTVAPQATSAGIILGTAAYMSPEQARGKPLDKRTDVWSFGCVLYETLTGRQAFSGETVSDTIVAILGREPDWQALPATTPAKIRDLLRRCLQKDPTRRLRDIGDARIEIEEALGEPASVAVSSAAVMGAARPAPWRRAVPWVAGAAIGAIAVVGILLRTPPTKASASRVVRFVTSVPLEYPLAASFGTINSTAIALSPDGSRFVYVAARGESIELQMRVLDRFASVSLPGTEGGRCPFFSLDGQWVGFFSRGKLKKVNLVTGAVVSLAPAGFAWGASWGADSIVFTPGAAMGIWSVPENGGEQRLVATPDFAKGERSYRFPELLPGGRDILLTVTGGGEPRIAIRSLSTGEQQILVEGGTNAHYSRTGHLVYVRAGVLLAVPFDLEHRKLTGSPVAVASDVLVDPQTGAAQITFSQDGTLVYVPGGPQSGRRDLVWIDRKGATRPLPPKRTFGAHPSLSPDGRRMAIEITEQGNVDIWIYDFARDSLTRLTFDAGEDIVPIWTPDGRRIAFGSNRNGPMDLFWTAADGSGPEELLLAGPGGQMPSSCSPNGRLLAYTYNEQTEATGLDIWVLPLEGKEKPRPFLRTPFQERAPAFSPDGQWVAYASDETGRDEVFVRPFPGPGQKWRISTEGGTEPAWSRDGTELFFRNGDRMMVAAVRTGATFEAGKPAFLFESQSETDPPFRTFQVSADGEQFLMVRSSKPDSPAMPVAVVLNWFEELRRLVPSGKR